MSVMEGVDDPDLSLWRQRLNDADLILRLTDPIAVVVQGEAAARLRGTLGQIANNFDASGDGLAVA